MLVQPTNLASALTWSKPSCYDGIGIKNEQPLDDSLLYIFQNIKHNDDGISTSPSFQFKEEQDYVLFLARGCFFYLFGTWSV